jgi:hypothetical protein
MPTTYEPIATTTLGSAQASVTFSSISASYTDLVLVTQAATAHSSATLVYVEFNSDTGANYSTTSLYGTGSSAASNRQSSNNFAWIGFNVGLDTSVGSSNIITQIQNYSNTTTNKTLLSRSNRGNSTLDFFGTEALVSLWRSTAAINSITIKNIRSGTTYNFASGSTFTLYGIKAA